MAGATVAVGATLGGGGITATPVRSEYRAYTANKANIDVSTI